MQQATLIKKGEVAESSKNTYISYQNMQDANLRANRNGDVAAILNQATLQNAILQAANDILTNHKGDPDYWNDDLNCAELTYHQLQWYILDGVLLDRDTADDENHKLSFCHLHAACADLVSNKPKTWADVMEAAAQRDADRLKQLSFDELRDMTHLRNNANGGDFSSRDVMINRLINAVNGDAALTDWVDVQKALLNGNGDVDTYWWYDGSTANTAPGNWDAMLDRVTPAITPQDYPDGASRTTKSKLESVRSLFDANAAAGQNKATRQWINVTDNLVAAHREEQVEVEVNGEVMQEWHYTYTPLADFDAFTTNLVEIIETAQTGGFGAPSWEAVQYHLLFPGETLDFINEPWNNVKLLNTEGWDPDTDPPPKQWPEGYWFRSGNIPLTVDNIYTLLEAMKLLNGDDKDEQKRAEEALKTVTWERLEGNNFWLRSSQTGDRWTTADPPKTGALTAEEWQVFQDAQTAGAYNWNTLQYYLIHGALAMKEGPTGDQVIDTGKINREALYYWWNRGGEGTRLDFTGTNLQTVFLVLSEAGLRGGQFGDPLAVQSVTDAAGERGGYKDWLRLTTSPLAFTQEDGRKRSELAHYADDASGTAALLAALDEFAVYARQAQGVDAYARPDLMDWHQVQYWLLHPELPDAQRYINPGTDPYKEAQETYWWYDQEEKPKEVVTKNPEPSDPMVENILKWCVGDLTDAALKNTLTAAKMNNTYKIYRTATGGTHATTPPPTMTSQLNASKTKMLNLAKAVKASEYYDAGSNTAMIYWAQIQYFWLNNALVDNQTALQWLVNKGWSKAGGTGTVKKIPNEVDLSVLNP